MESSTSSSSAGSSGIHGRAVLSFVILAALFFGLLRLIHLVVPVFYPQVLSGPFSVTTFDEVEELAGFSPQLPFFRPQVLGTRPVHITVSRRPRPRVVTLWQAERFLRLEEQRGGELEGAPPTARPLPEHPDSLWWREGTTHHVQLRRDGLWIDLRTDLPLQDVERLVETLRPHEEML